MPERTSTAEPEAASGRPRPTRRSPGEPLRLPRQPRERAEEHLADYLGVLHRHRWAALAAFFLVFVPVAVITIGATAEFESTVRILLDAEAPAIPLSQDPARDQASRSKEYFDTQFQILKSRALAHRTISRLKLWEHPEYSGKKPQKQGMIGSVRNMLAKAGSLFKRGNEVTKQASASTDPSTDPAIVGALLSHLTVSPLTGTRLVDVTFESTDPKLAAELANTLAQAYIQQDLQSQSSVSQGTTEFLTDRLQEQRQKVTASEKALQDYRESHNAVSLEERQNIVVAKLTDLNGAVTKAKTDRIAKEGVYKQLMAVRNDRQALDGFPAILSNAFIQSLKTQLAELQRDEARLSEQYGDQHPEMIRIRSVIRPAEARLQAEIEKVIQSVQNDYLAAEAQEKSLTSALEQQKREAMDLNRMGIEYGALQREATSNRGILENLMKDSKEAGISADLTKATIRIVDNAEIPRWPVRPKRLQSLLLSLGGGLCFALGLVVVLEYFDSRLRTPDQIVASLKIPFIACVPKTSDHPGLSNGVPSHFGEAFRRIRTKVLSASHGGRGFSIVVTSTGPREGKSVVASNLAVSLAKAEQRVLLIDADMRRPRGHKLFELPLQPGLSDLLAGGTSGERIIRPTRFPGLSLLSAGAPPENPSELLASSRFRTLLSALGEHFDWIVIDSPPIMAVADAAIVADEVSSVLFVVAADLTREDAARVALNELASVRPKLLGAVLNRVDFSGQSYYYSRYYRPEYEAYYLATATDDHSGV